MPGADRGEIHGPRQVGGSRITTERSVDIGSILF